MRSRTLLAGGIAMPLIYLAALVAGALLMPGYRPLEAPPSVLGGPGAPHPEAFNIGVILTGLAGAVGAVGIAAGLSAFRRDLRSALLGGLAGLTLVAGSIGLAMSGLFPLPDTRHYGFGLTPLAAFTPLFGALGLFRNGGARRSALGLIALFVLILALVVLRAPPLAAGLTMMVSVAVLSWSLRRRLHRV